MLPQTNGRHSSSELFLLDSLHDRMYQQESDDTLYIGRDCSFYGDTLYEEEKAFLFFRVLYVNMLYLYM